MVRAPEPDRSPTVLAFAADGLPRVRKGQSMEWRPGGIVSCHDFEQAPAAMYGTAGADGGAAAVADRP